MCGRKYETLPWMLHSPQFWLLCSLFIHCDDCGPIKMAVILTRPFIWLVAPLVLSFIQSICHTAECTSVIQLWLMLKVCRPLMWWFSEGNFNLGAAGDGGGGPTSKRILDCDWGNRTSSPKTFRDDVKNTAQVCKSMLIYDTECGSLFCGVNISPLRTLSSVPGFRGGFRLHFWLSLQVAFILATISLVFVSFNRLAPAIEPTLFFLCYPSLVSPLTLCKLVFFSLHILTDCGLVSEGAHKEEGCVSLTVMELIEIKTWKLFVTQLMPNVQLTSIHHDDYNNDCCCHWSWYQSYKINNQREEGSALICFEKTEHFVDLG